MPDRSASPAFLLKRVSQAFKHRLDQNPDRLPLTQAQAGVMFYLSRAEEEGRSVSPSDLESGLHLSRPTVTGLLQRLESRGYITAAPDENDKRYKRLRATPAFKAHIQLMESYFARQEETLFNGFSPEEKARFNDYLTRMLHNLTQGGND